MENKKSKTKQTIRNNANVSVFKILKITLNTLIYVASIAATNQDA